MRTKNEMIELIISTAKQDDNIRVVVMNGSRVNPSLLSDKYQDYDIVYFVKDLHAVSKDFSWLDVFGERLMMQSKDDMLFDPPVENDYPVYLMQFKDGNRIDLSLMPIENIHQAILEDSLVEVLLDKDDLLENIPSSNESSYYVSKPSKAVFDSCINECYWVSLYVMKGVKRNHLPYAISHMDILRKCLCGMFDWYIGDQHDYKISVGKQGGKYPLLLPQHWVERYLATYTEANPDQIKVALYTLLSLFNEVTEAVSKALNYESTECLYHEIIAYLNTMERD